MDEGSAERPEAPQLDETDLEFVRKVARSFVKLVPSSIPFDELLSYGTLGMIDARKRFDPSRGIPFHAFAHYRIRGAVYDGLREMSWLSPNAYKRLRVRERSDLYMESLAESACGSPSRTAAAQLIGQVAADMSVVYLTTEAAAQAREDRPRAATLPGEDVCDLGRVLDQVDKLSDQEQMLIRKLYVEDASLSEAGKALGLSRSWLCRFHASTIRKLRRRLGIAPEGPADNPAP
ncbi:MAG: sigma-70 family RNA polymerase sigma factor [Deltaproteobacteria bacterium]|nr:sigma-70 family RNA polymerase sigma factor [Deltaproteobacteria bacterium]